MTSFVLISYLEKDHSMSQTRRLKNVFFFRNNLKFCAVKKIIKGSIGIVISKFHFYIKVRYINLVKYFI